MLIFDSYLLLYHASWCVLYLAVHISELLWQGIPFVIDNGPEQGQDNTAFWRESVRKAKKITHWFRAKIPLQAAEGMLTQPRAEPRELLPGARQLCWWGFPALPWKTVHGNCAPSLGAPGWCTGPPWGTRAHKKAWRQTNKCMYRKAFMCSMELGGFHPCRLACAVNWDGGQRWGESFDKSFCAGVWGGTTVMKWASTPWGERSLPCC